MPLHAEALVNDRLINAVTEYLQTFDSKVFPFTAGFDDEKQRAFVRDLRIGLSDLTESGSKRGTSSTGFITSDKRLQTVVRDWAEAEGGWPKGQDPRNPWGVASVLDADVERQALQQPGTATSHATVDDSILVEEALAYEDSLGNATAYDLTDASLVDGAGIEDRESDVALSADDEMLSGDAEALEQVDALGSEPLADEVLVVEEEILIVETIDTDSSAAVVAAEANEDAGTASDFSEIDSGEFNEELEAASNESALIDYSIPDDQIETDERSIVPDQGAADMAVAGDPPFEVQEESEIVTSGAAGTVTSRSSKLPTEGEGSAWVAGDGTRDVPAGFPIKGNADSGIYHPIESSGYNNTIAEVYFRDGETAEQFGYRMPKNLAQHATSLGDKVADAAEDSTDKDQ